MYDLFDNAHTNNNKRFWSLVKQLRKNHQSVATLCVENELKTSPSAKAEAHNQKFYSVFTRENNDIPLVSFPKYPNMANIEFITQGIVKLLQELKPGISAGPDKHSHMDTKRICFAYSTSFTSNLYTILPSTAYRNVPALIIV